MLDNTRFSGSPHETAHRHALGCCELLVARLLEQSASGRRAERDRCRTGRDGQRGLRRERGCRRWRGQSHFHLDGVSPRSLWHRSRRNDREPRVLGLEAPGSRGLQSRQVRDRAAVGLLRSRRSHGREALGHQCLGGLVQRVPLRIREHAQRPDLRKPTPAGFGDLGHAVRGQRLLPGTATRFDELGRHPEACGDVPARVWTPASSSARTSIRTRPRSTCWSTCAR